MYKLTKIALAAGLATSAFAFTPTAPAEARGAISLDVPGFSLYIGPRYHHRRYHRSYYYGPRYYYWKRYHKRHRKYRRHHRRHHRHYHWR